MARFLLFGFLPAALLILLFLTGHRQWAAIVFLVLAAVALAQLLPAAYRTRKVPPARDSFLQVGLFLLAAMVSALGELLPTSRSPGGSPLFLLQLGLVGLALLLSPHLDAEEAEQNQVARPHRQPVPRRVFMWTAIAFIAAALAYVGQGLPGVAETVLHPALAAVFVFGVLTGAVLLLRIVRES